MKKLDARIYNDIRDRWKIDDLDAYPENVLTNAISARDDIKNLIEMIDRYEEDQHV